MNASANPTGSVARVPRRGPRAWLTSCALALLPVVQDPPREAPRGIDPVEREWTIRRWALEPREHAQELVEAAASADWERRQAALEALLRAGPAALGARHREAIRAALADAHPNVRATALAAAARAGLELEAERLAILATDPWPEVRHELARFVARAPGAPGTVEALGVLLAADDPRLVRAARRAALQFAFAGLDPPLDLAAATRAPEGFLSALELLARGAQPGRWFGPLVESTSAFEPRERETRVGLILAAFGIFEGWDPERVVHGWLGTPGDDPDLEGRARGLRLAAAEARGRRGPPAPDPGACFWWPGEAVPAAIFGGAAAAADALARGAKPRPLPEFPFSSAGLLPSELERAAAAGIALPEAAERLLEAALLLADSEPSSLANALRGAGDDLAESFWLGVASKARFWQRAELAHWWRSSTPRVRAAFLGAVAQTFARSGDLVARRTLVEALGDDDPALRRIAFGALARAEDARPFAQELVESWRREDDATRSVRLRDLPRAVALEAFRDELVEQWESGRPRQVAVLELLRPFGPDAELAARAGAWFEAELAALEREAAARAEDPALDFAPRSGRPAETEREGHSKALAALYAALAGEAGLEQLERWLERAEPVSLEVAKVLVNLMARRAQGRARLVGWLEPPRRTRLRVEAALGLLGEREALLAPEGSDSGGGSAGTLAERASALLIERYPRCDQPLRARILGSLAGYTHLPAVRARLVETALGVGFDGAERLRALDSLERGARVESARASGLRDAIEVHLVEVLETSVDVDVRRAVVEALGRSGGERASQALEELAALPRGAPRREYVEDRLLPARARIGRAPGLEREVWAAPRAAAAGELRARFAGRRLSSREFDYRAELEAAMHLAAAGRLEAMLAAERWWELDARFLSLLGERLFTSPNAAVRARAAELVRAARIGLEGEGSAPDREPLLVAARARLARAAFEGQRPADALGDVEELLLAWRLAELGPRELFAPLGPWAPDAGRDPLAWLEASVLQARAHAALDRGESEPARALAREAGARLGSSERARAQQERLLARLAE